jgi:hypothetical protein
MAATQKAIENTATQANTIIETSNRGGGAGPNFSKSQSRQPKILNPKNAE